MFKKTFILLLSAVFICMAFTVVSSATDACKIDLSYHADEEILFLTITYSDFTDPDGVIAVSSNVFFDKTVLEFQSVEAELPEEWGEHGVDWSKLYADGNVLICMLFDSGEKDHGTTDPISCTVSFKMLSKNADTLVEIKNNWLTESDDLITLIAPNASLNISISESGDVSGNVSEEEISVPQTSVEASKTDGSENADNSGKDESDKSESSVPSSDSSSDKTEDGGNNAAVWIIVGAAIVVIAAVVTVVVMKKKN